MLTYETFRRRDHFTQHELLAFAWGRLVSGAPAGFEARLPLPPLLMVDRIVRLDARGSRGRLVAERDVRIDDWFFQSHFVGDPVQPGCLGVDAVWQLLGFYAVWRGGLGTGRALGCGAVDFFGQIRPHDHTVQVDIEVRRYSHMAGRGASMVLGDATVRVDGQDIYTIERARAGLFRDIAYRDYPHASEHARGGPMARDTTDGRNP